MTSVISETVPTPRPDEPPSLSVIVPVYNGQGWIGRCLTSVRDALDVSGLTDVEIIVVDDGSTDGTVDEATSASVGALALRVVSQPNSGRFLARRHGLDVATKEYVLFVDVRVFIDRDALRFVADRLSRPDEAVWTSHVEANTDESYFAGFWQAIEHVVWRRYWRQPRTTSFGLSEFDYFPKGTTALVAPRQALLDAFDAFEPIVDDWSKVNDDTAVLRWVAERYRINISPQYSSRYHARADLRAFLRHAFHRGTVLIDGYLRPGTRFAVPIVAVLAVSPVAAVVVLRHPIRAARAAVAGSALLGIGARTLGARSKDATVLATLAVPFGVAYLAGLWRGAAMRARSARRTRAGARRGSSL